VRAQNPPFGAALAHVTTHQLTAQIGGDALFPGPDACHSRLVAGCYRGGYCRMACQSLASGGPRITGRLLRPGVAAG